MSSKPAEGGQPSPPVRIVVLGATGSGKTSFVKALVYGKEVESTLQLTVGNSVESETDATNVVKAGKFLILDPPGIGDTRGNDENNMVELARTVRDLEHVHLIVLVFNGQQVRLDAPIVQMLRLFENVFGPAFWANAALVFTRWFRDEIGELPGDEVGKQREWNSKLQTEFPFLSEYRKAAPIPCFFVNSVVVHEERYRASQQMKGVVAQMESTMKGIRMLAQALQPFRTGGMSASHAQTLFAQPGQPLQIGNVSVSQQLPKKLSAATAATTGDVGEFLHGLGLAQHIPRVLEQKIYTRDILAELSGLEMASLGFSRDEISRIRSGGGSYAVHDLLLEGERADTPEQLAIELGSLDVPTEPFATCTVHAALSLSEDLLLNRLPLLGDRQAFRRWKRQRLAGQKVSAGYLWLGAHVERGFDWEYDQDSDDDCLPQDGVPGGHGIVVGWHPCEGDRVGEDVPFPRGWVRVRWLITGFCHNYRAGADSKFDLRFAGSTLNDQSLDGVEKLEIKHLRCTFGYPTGVRHPHYSMFDVRPEVCRMVGGFEHGDVVMEGRDEATRAVCIGVKPDGRKRILLWFQVKTKHARGAGIFDDLDNGKYRKVGHEQVLPAKREDFTGGSDGEIENDDRDYVTKNLHATFGYDSRKGFKRFDTRNEIIAKFKLGVRHGDVLMDKDDGKKYHCIGVALLGKGNMFPRVWFHEDGDIGAAVVQNMHKALGKLVLLRNEPVAEVPEDQCTDLTEEDLRAIAAELQLTFEFPMGITAKPSLGRFDIRPNIVSRITGGLLPGQVFDLQGEKLVVVGAAPNPRTNQLTVWFHRQGDPGAGQLDLGYRHMRRVLRDSRETKDLSELKRQLEASPNSVSSRGRGDLEDLEDVHRKLRELLVSAMEAHRVGRG